MNGGNTLETLGNLKNSNTNNQMPDISHNSRENNYYATNTSHRNQNNNNLHRSSYQTNFRRNKKISSDNDTTSNSSDLFKQIYFAKDANESGQASKRYTNLNITPMDIVTTFNEKLDNNNEHTPSKNLTNNINLNPINETKYKKEEDENRYSPRRSISKNFASPKKFNNSIQHGISDKEKRTILEHYRNLYSFKKTSPSKNSPNRTINDKKLSMFPLINKKNINNTNNPYHTQNNFSINNAAKIQDNMNNNYMLNEGKKKNLDDIEQNFNSTQKNSMFRSSIYSNLMPTYNKFYKKKRSNTTQHSNFIESESDVNNSFNKIPKSKNQTIYGPFLHIDNKFDKKITIKNPEIKRSLEDINYYGPYFSHCPICRFKNLDFYQTMEPHQCMKLLNYIKLKRSKIQVK